MDAAVNAVLARLLQDTLNHTLTYDPGTQVALADLAGRSLTLEFTAPSAQFCCRFEKDGVHLSGLNDEPVDCRARGELQAWVALMLRQKLLEPSGSLADSGIEITGDVSLMQRLQQIVQRSEFDWPLALQQPLNQLLGSEAATLISHPLIQALRAPTQWLQNRAPHWAPWATDWISEEMRWVPPAAELQAFFEDIDAVRAQTERLEARILRLQKRLTPSPPTQPSEAPKQE